MEVEGFIKLPIKIMTEDMAEEFNKKIEEYNSLGLDKISLDEYVNEDEYIEESIIYIRPDSIKSFKPAKDGYVDVAISDPLSFSRVFIKFEEFIELINK